MASAITFTSLTFSGAPSSDDQLAAKYIVGLENNRLASLIPPGTPFPVDTPSNLKSSYLTILLAIVTSAHASYISQARGPSGAQVGFTDAQIEQIRVNLVTRLNNGESASSIIADTATL